MFVCVYVCVCARVCIHVCSHVNTCISIRFHRPLYAYSKFTFSGYGDFTASFMQRTQSNIQLDFLALSVCFLHLILYWYLCSEAAVGARIAYWIHTQHVLGSRLDGNVNFLSSF